MGGAPLPPGSYLLRMVSSIGRPLRTIATVQRLALRARTKASVDSPVYQGLGRSSCWQQRPAPRASGASRL